MSTCWTATARLWSWPPGQETWGGAWCAQRYAIPLTHERSLVARAGRTLQSVIVNDVRQIPDFLPDPLLPHTPIRDGYSDGRGWQADRGDRRAGYTAERFSAEDVNVQTTLAAQVAIAINNARLFTENARRLAIIENSDDLISLASLVERPYRPIHVNPAGLRLTGYDTLEEFTRQSLEEFYTPQSIAYLRQTAMPVVLKHDVWRGESTLRRKDGTSVPIEQTIFVIHATKRASRTTWRPL